VGQALQLKKMISYASLKKIPAMINCAGPHDNRVRGTLTFHGAGPGRWSATLVQPQNFKRPTIDETEEVYDAICSGCDAEWLREMYGPPLEMVSSSIRHFIHDTANGDMLDADYAAIEARVIAWQADEEWRLDVFRTHGKIYEASASQMFSVPLQEFDEYRKKNGKHHPLRQKGKTAELACIAEGQLVTTDHGLVPIEKVTRDMLVYDGKEFVKHDGVVYQGIKEVITYEHLTATKDHIVFTRIGTSQFGDAARSKKNLLQSKPSRQDIRFCRNHFRRTEIHQRQLERRICASKMHKLWACVVDIRREPYEREKQRVLQMQSATASPSVVIETCDSDGSEMQQPERQRTSQLREPRDQIQFRHDSERGFMGD
jgi:DNA polymerase